jgi:hypothetical protein
VHLRGCSLECDRIYHPSCCCMQTHRGHNARWLCTSAALRTGTRSKSARTIRHRAACCSSPPPRNLLSKSHSRSSPPSCARPLGKLKEIGNHQYIAVESKGREHTCRPLLPPPTSFSPWLCFGRRPIHLRAATSSMPRTKTVRSRAFLPSSAAASSAPSL